MGGQLGAWHGVGGVGVRLLKLRVRFMGPVLHYLPTSNYFCDLISLPNWEWLQRINLQ